MSSEHNPGDEYPQDAAPPEAAPQEGYPQGEAAPQEVPPPPGMEYAQALDPAAQEIPAPDLLQQGYEQEAFPAEAEAFPAQAEAPELAADDGLPPPPLGFEPDAGGELYAEEPQAAYGVVDGPEVMAAGGTPAPEPADDGRPKKKRRIDLKARLSSVRAAGTMAGTSGPGSEAAQDATFPPPPPTGSVPPPRMLSSDGIAPPAALLAQHVPDEKESLPSAQAQTIKVEVGEEIIAERRKTRLRMALYVGLTALVTLFVGFFLGSTKEKGTQQKTAIQGASGIAKDVDAASVVLSDLSDTLRGATEMLGQEKYPKDLAEKLKGTHVPFSAEGLTGKKIGGLPGSVLQALLLYAGDVERLNKRKDKLRNLLGMAKKPFDEYVSEKKEPKLRYSVVFAPGNKGMLAELAPHKAAFAVGADKWPEKYKVTRLMRGKPQEVEVERWKKGDLTGKTPLAIPVDQATVSGFTTKRMIFELKKALTDTKNLVDGRESPRPTEATDGLLKDGEQLIAELKKIAQKG